jgi:hypothetical protein
MCCGKRISLSSKNQRAVISFCTALARSKEQPMASATRRRLVSTTSQLSAAEEPGRVAAASLPLTTVAITTRPLWVQHVLDFTPTVLLLLTAMGGAVALGINLNTSQAKINSLQTEMKAMEKVAASEKEMLLAKLKAHDTKLKAQEEINKAREEINKERLQRRGLLGYIFGW